MIDIDFRDELKVSGGRYKVLQTLCRTVSAICRDDRTVRRFYIGIASGINFRQALHRRVDEWKDANEIDEMILLYESSSQRFCREVEDYLIKQYMHTHPNNVNRRRGKAGRPTTQPYSYVYLGVARVGRHD